jgi:hypothetical protein
MDVMQPLWPPALADPEPVADPLADHQKTIAEARVCPCWKCPQRPGCGSSCSVFKRYVAKGK